MDTKFDLKSIIPAIGWYSAYVQNNGDVYFEPLIAWAHLVIQEDGEKYSKVVGITASAAASPEEYYPLSDNFLGYCGPEDFSDPGLKLKQGVSPRNAWGTK